MANDILATADQTKPLEAGNIVTGLTAMLLTEVGEIVRHFCLGISGIQLKMKKSIPARLHFQRVSKTVSGTDTKQKIWHVSRYEIRKQRHRLLVRS
jgi:hypothetical protein